MVSQSRAFYRKVNGSVQQFRKPKSGEILPTEFYQTEDRSSPEETCKLGDGFRAAAAALSDRNKVSVVSTPTLTF